MGDLTIYISDIVGFIGVVILIVTYLMLTLDLLSAKGFWYSFLNLCVAILVGYSLIFRPNFASIAIEFFWGIISIIGLIRYYVRHYLQHSKRTNAE